MHSPHGEPERARKGPKGPDKASEYKNTMNDTKTEDIWFPTVGRYGWRGGLQNHIPISIFEAMLYEIQQMVFF